MTNTPEPEQSIQNVGPEPRAVLVAVDASAGAALVVSTAARLCRSLPEAAVHVVHVFRTSLFSRTGGPVQSNADLVEDSKEHLAFHVRNARHQCRNPVTGHFVLGDPTAELLRMATDLEIDLLVVGTHYPQGLERLLLGSIAETLMRKAPCSVLVVRLTARATG